MLRCSLRSTTTRKQERGQRVIKAIERDMRIIVRRVWLLLGVVILMLGMASCYFPSSPPLPTASFEITRWTQDYYEYSEEYSPYVYVYYKATNSGSVSIDYYEVWIEVTCDDGSKFQEWTNGLNLACGTYVTDYTMINVSGERAVSVSITNCELTSYSW